MTIRNVTLTHHGLEQLIGSLSCCSNLEKLERSSPSCSDNCGGCCLPVLDLQKHNKLKELDLQDLSVEGLLLPMDEARVCELTIFNLNQ